MDSFLARFEECLRLDPQGRLREMLEMMLSFWESENYQIKSDARNEKLRPGIAARLATSLMTDDERAAFYGLPAGCRLRENAKIISLENLKIGSCCWIGEGAILDASGGLEIGSHTSIGLNVLVWSHDSFKLNLRGENTPENSHKIRRKSTKIGSNCFIGGPSVIMPGVSIADRCVIAPGSVVYEDIGEKTVYQPYRKMLEGLERIEVLEDEVKKLKDFLKK